MGLPRSISYLHEILQQYDKDGDGSIDWYALNSTCTCPSFNFLTCQGKACPLTAVTADIQGLVNTAAWSSYDTPAVKHTSFLR